MSHLSYNPDRNLHKRIISKILNNLNVSFNKHINKFRLDLYHLLQSFKKIINTGFCYKLLKFVKYLIHPSQEYFFII